RNIDSPSSLPRAVFLVSCSAERGPRDYSGWPPIATYFRPSSSGLVTSSKDVSPSRIVALVRPGMSGACSPAPAATATAYAPEPVLAQPPVPMLAHEPKLDGFRGPALASRFSHGAIAEPKRPRPRAVVS